MVAAVNDKAALVALLCFQRFAMRRNVVPLVVL